MSEENKVIEKPENILSPEIQKTPKKSKKAVIIIAAVLAIVLITGAALTSYFLYFEPLSRYENAVKLMNLRQYDNAKEMFAELGDFKDSAERIKECDYKEAKKLIEKGDYASAREKLKPLGDYKKSVELISESTYLEATRYLEEEEFALASELFASISDYKNSKELCAKSHYDAAKEFLEEEKYKEAIEHFEAAGDYEDSYEQLYLAILSYSGYLVGTENYKEGCSILETIYSIPGYDTPANKTEINNIYQLSKELNYSELRSIYFAMAEFTRKDVLDVMVGHRKTAAKSGANYQSAITALYSGAEYYGVFNSINSESVKAASDALKKLVKEKKDMVLNKVNYSFDEYAELHKLIAAAFPDFEAYVNYVFSANFDSPEVYEKKAEELRQKCLPHIKKIEAELATIDVPV